MWSHGQFYWNELMTHDPERAKKFYGDTIGWTFEGMPMDDGSGTYWAGVRRSRRWSYRDPDRAWRRRRGLDDAGRRVSVNPALSPAAASD
jgi:hypothetical protein